MADCSRLDFSCKLAEAGQEAAGTVIDDIVEDITTAVEQSIGMLSTFWVHVPVVGISETTGVTAFLRNYLNPYVFAVVVISVMIGSLRLMFAKDSEPGRDLAAGLTRVVTVAALSVPLISMLGFLTDAISVDIIDRAIDQGDFGTNLLTVMMFTAGGNPVLGFFVTLLVGVFTVPTAMVQAALMFLRLIMLPLLAGTMTLSAAFFATERGRQWFQSSLLWLIAFLAYKPAASIIYASGFVMMGNGTIIDAETMTQFAFALLSFVMGFMLMVLAVVSLFALIGFVVPVAGKLTGGGSGAMFAASAGGIIATGAISNGLSGRDGNSGSSGAQGPSGAARDPGAGPQGHSGSTSAGKAGATGAAGATGGAATGVQLAGETAKAVKRGADGAVEGKDKE